MFKLVLEKAEEPGIKLPTSIGWASLIAQLVKNPPAMQETTVEGIGYPLQYSWTSLVAQQGNNLPAIQET